MEDWFNIPESDRNRGLAGHGFHGERVPKLKMRFGSSKSLSDFPELQFFTPALLYLFGRFNDEPLAEFVNTQPGLLIRHRKFKRPIFRGLTTPGGNADWNHVLWSVPAEVWPQFENFLLSITMVLEANRWVSRIGAQDITIVDPLTVDQCVVLPAVLPTLPIVVLGVDGNQLCVAMDPGKSTYTDPPKIKYHPPQPETVAFADALFVGGNPMAARAASLEQQKKDSP